MANRHHWRRTRSVKERTDTYILQLLDLFGKGLVFPLYCVLKCVYCTWCNVNGIELNFISLLHNLKIYIQGEMLLPLILVRSQIRSMLGGETGKSTWQEQSKNLGLAVKWFLLCAVHRYVVKMWSSRLLVLSSWPCLSPEGMWCAF